MSKEKRDRQHANRELKRAERQKLEKRKKRWAIVKRYAAYTLAFVAAIIALKLFSG